MAETKIITKQLAGTEDILTGIGAVNQQRSTGIKTITKLNVSELNGIYAVNTKAEFDLIDTDLLGAIKVVNVIEENMTYKWNGASWVKPSSLELTNKNGKVLTIENNDSALTDKVVAYFDTVEDLAEYAGLKGDVAHVADMDRGGMFVCDPDAVDNGGTVFGKWVRQYDGAVNVKWFGAKGDSYTDDTDAIQKALDLSVPIYLPIGHYASRQLNSSGQTFSITGEKALNSLGARSGFLALEDTLFNVQSINQQASYLELRHFAGSLVDENGDDITIIRIDGTNDMVLSATPYRGGEAITFNTDYPATDGTIYNPVIRFAVMGAWIANGGVQNADGTYTLTGVLGAEGTLNSYLSGTVGHNIEGFASLEYRDTSSTKRIFFLDVRENSFFDHLWFSKVGTAFKYAALGSGAGVNSSAGNVGQYSNIFTDQALYFIDADGSIDKGTFSAIQLYSTLVGFKADKITDNIFTNCTLIASKLFEANEVKKNIVTGNNFVGGTGIATIENLVVATTIEDTVFDGNVWGRSSTPVIIATTLNNVSLVGGSIESFDETHNKGFIKATDITNSVFRIANTKKISGSELFFFFNTTTPDLTDSIFDGSYRTNIPLSSKIPQLGSSSSLYTYLNTNYTNVANYLNYNGNLNQTISFAEDISIFNFTNTLGADRTIKIGNHITETSNVKGMYTKETYLNFQRVTFNGYKITINDLNDTTLAVLDGTSKALLLRSVPSGAGYYMAL